MLGSDLGACLSIGSFKGGLVGVLGGLEGRFTISGASSGTPSLNNSGIIFFNLRVYFFQNFSAYGVPIWPCIAPRPREEQKST